MFIDLALSDKKKPQTRREMLDRDNSYNQLKSLAADEAKESVRIARSYVEAHEQQKKMRGGSHGLIKLAQNSSNPTSQQFMKYQFSDVSKGPFMNLNSSRKE